MPKTTKSETTNQGPETVETLTELRDEELHVAGGFAQRSDAGFRPRQVSSVREEVIPAE